MDLIFQPPAKVELPLEELGSQKSMDNSLKKKSLNKNGLSNMIFEPNDQIGISPTNKHGYNEDRFVDGIELDYIYNDKK